ncbi:MAG: RraA family protein [Treponemataceae bacterium]
MTDDERNRLLNDYADLRVCDVRDGLDALGYHFYGSMGPDIRPLYRTRAFGIAKTVRYLPYRGGMIYSSPRQYRDEFTPYYYNSVCSYPWTKELRDGDFAVIDQSGTCVGLMGSENTLACRNSGMRGLVTNGGIRDTDEIILQKIPCWSAMIAQPMVQGRLAFDAMDVPVAVGGVQVRSGDMIVADGDGIVVVPLEIARQVAQFAHEEHESDKKNRRKHYEEAGLALDETVM